MRHPSLLQGCDPRIVNTIEVIIPAKATRQSKMFWIRAIAEDNKNKERSSCKLQEISRYKKCLIIV